MERKVELDRIFNTYDISSEHRPGVIEVAKMLCDDPDGLWSMLDDYGWPVSYEDCVKLTEIA